MKILIVSAFPTEGAGSGTLITTQAKSYVEAGHDVTILTANNRTNYRKLEGVKYHTVPFTGEGTNPETIDGQLPFNYFMFTTHTESTANFWNVTLEQLDMYCKKFKEALEEEVRELNPDVIHAQHNWLLSSEATKMNKPVVTTIHGTDLMGYEKAKIFLENVNEEINILKKDKDIRHIEEIFSNMDLTISDLIAESRRILNEVKPENKEKVEQAINLYSERRKFQFYINEAENSARNTDKFIVISEDQKKQFIKLFPFAKDKVELIENGYDPKTFYVEENVDKEQVLGELHTDATEDGKIPTDYTDLILFVGKFADFKGIDSSLAAAKKYEEELIAKGRKPLTIIVGSGEQEEKLKTQAKMIKLKNTHFVGRQGPDVIRRLQNLATVSLIPSRKEPFGLVVIEGTACGHPVIGSNSGGIPDILNTKKKKLSNDDIIKTDLGVLVRPLPDRPTNLSKDDLKLLDIKSSEYMSASKQDKENIVNELSHILSIGKKEMRKYLEEYMLSTNALSESVVKICTGELKFDNGYIAKYTKETYSQPKIREKLLDLFNRAIEAYQNRRAKEVNGVKNKRNNDKPKT